ncbi:GTP cyclohydrolase 1 [Yarrowia sp. B02]|nr:GTP cyclohydrolase 1 [Yarrowia sp. B02]
MSGFDDEERINAFEKRHDSTNTIRPELNGRVPVQHPQPTVNTSLPSVPSTRSSSVSSSRSKLSQYSYLQQEGTPLNTRVASPYTLNPPIDFDGLSWPSVGARARLEQTEEEAKAREGRIADAVKTILTELGEDPNREGLLETPERYARAMLFFTKGYEDNVKDVIKRAVFEEDHDEMVIVRDIEIFSLCEHHLVPFFGKIHIGYIPNSRVLGLSKLARLAEMFSRRLQVQERLTKQVAMALWEILEPQGVAVVIEASHMCMVSRGVQKSGSSTLTSCMLGRFRDAQKTRDEFLTLIGKR